MSDDDRDLDLDSDEEGSGGGAGGGQDKRAHLNALERRRRDHIKDSFTGLKDAIPGLQQARQGDKCSRAQILKKVG
jgi:Max protein